MRKDLDKVNDTLNKATERADGDYPLRSRDDASMTDYREPVAAGYPFFNFRYMYLEVSSLGGQASVKARETRFENGRLISEECEGTLDHDAVQRMMVEAQHQFARQMMAFMQPFFAFSPFRLTGRSDE